MMNMHIEKVYCRDLDKIINIYDAEIEYFKPGLCNRKSA